MFFRRHLNWIIISIILFLLLDNILSQKTKNSKQNTKLSKKTKEVIKQEVPFLQKFYTKTYGQIKFDRKRVRSPAKGSILGCVVKCWATSDCICARINSVNDECDTFVANRDDPNAEQNQTLLSNYVYYSNNEGQDLGENIAIGKKVTQSSTYNQFKAQKAFDNNAKTESKTSGGKVKRKNGLPWLQIDLRDEYVITGVTLQSKDAQSLHDFEIRVGNRQISRADTRVQFKDNPLCFGYIGNNFLQGSKPRTVKCEVCYRYSYSMKSLIVFTRKPCPVSGKYVTIQIINDCIDCPNPGQNGLNLAELQVYGYLAK